MGSSVKRLALSIKMKRGGIIKMMKETKENVTIVVRPHPRSCPAVASICPASSRVSLRHTAATRTPSITHYSVPASTGCSKNRELCYNGHTSPKTMRNGKNWVIWMVCSFVHSFVHSLVRSFVRPCLSSIWKFWACHAAFILTVLGYCITYM